MHEYPYRTCAEIDLNKLQRNLQRLRALIGPECRIMEVMKADAYGHGLRVCAEYAAPMSTGLRPPRLKRRLPCVQPRRTHPF